MAVSAPLSICYSVRARLGVGGMGTGMLASVRAAAEESWKVRALTAPGGKAPADVEVAGVALPWTSKLALMTPARFSPAWVRLFEEASHDRRAANMVGIADVFQGAGHGSLLSLRAAKRGGAITVIESMNAHARHLDRVMRKEERAAGSYAHFHNSLTVARCEAEYAETDYIYCNSSYTRQTLLEEGIPERKIIMVPLCVDQGSSAATHEAGGDFRVLFVGVLDLRKGFRYLLDAWSRLALRNAELYLRGGTGDRPCRRILEDFRQRIEFTQDLDYGPVPYNKFSVLVLPSISDGFGLVVLEAMAAGLPVIVSESVGASGCVREGIDGFIVPPADAESLAERIELLYKDRDTLAKMGSSARERAAEFSRQAFREKYIAAVRRIVVT